MKERLDVLLVKRNLAESREKAKAIIMSGNVFVEGQRAVLQIACFKTVQKRCLRSMWDEDSLIGN